MSRPLVVTLGEPAGIGPDITLTAWHRRLELGLAPFSFSLSRPSDSGGFDQHRTQLPESLR